MATVFDVAKYILHKKGEMSTWKLQKLCYYSQAWTLAWTGKPLFEEDFQAWRNGPVCPELFHEHKGLFSIKEEQLHKGDSTRLTEDEQDSVDTVLKGYGDMAPYELRNQTHVEDPWRNARGDLDAFAYSNTVIPKAVMGEYYGAL